MRDKWSFNLMNITGVVLSLITINLLLNAFLNPITILANQHLLKVRICIGFATPFFFQNVFPDFLRICLIKKAQIIKTMVDKPNPVDNTMAREYFSCKLQSATSARKLGKSRGVQEPPQSPRRLSSPP